MPRIRAVTAIAWGRAFIAPGDVVEVPDAAAAELVASGAAEPAPAAAAALERPAGNSPEPPRRPVTDVSGVGPATAERLAAAGIADLRALAWGDLEALDVDEGLRERIDGPDGWRAKARELEPREGP